MSSIEKEEKHLEISNIFLDAKLFKFPLLKVIYDDYDIKIKSKYSLKESKDDKIEDLKNILSKEPIIKCFECKKVISSYDFFAKKESTDIILCNDCYSKLKEKKEIEQKYISFDKYISTCEKHETNYDSFCINCNKNICPKCKDDHAGLGLKHEFIVFDNIFEEKSLYEKKTLCKKVKHLSHIFKDFSEIQYLEGHFSEGSKYNNIYERFTRENKLVEIIISTFSYFYEKKALCYELISSFNDINFDKELKSINVKSIIDAINNLLEHSFHIIMQSPDVLEKKRIKIIPLSHRNKSRSNYELDSEIRGLIELKGGYYLAGSKGGEIGIFDSEKLDLIQNFRLYGIKNIFHLEKIKDENSDLIAVASEADEVIIISVFQKDNIDTNNKEAKDNIFDYKFECRKKEHSGAINRIIQLSNGLLVSAAEDELLILWQLFKNDNIINIQSISKVEMNIDIHILIECPFTNELICNYKTIDLNTFTQKRELDLYLQDKTFNCQVCLFKEKYLAYVSGCDGIAIINLENGKYYFISAKFDYVDAVYSIDNETFCLCTRNLYSFFPSRCSQQYKLEEDDFVEIGEILSTGTCNCYMNDSKNNFVMGGMSGEITKFTI